MSTALPECAVPQGAREILADFGPSAPVDRHVTVDVDGANPREANAAALVEHRGVDHAAGFDVDLVRAQASRSPAAPQP